MSLCPNDAVICFWFMLFPRRVKLGCFAFTFAAGTLANAFAVDFVFSESPAIAVRNPRAIPRSIGTQHKRSSFKLLVQSFFNLVHLLARASCELLLL